jgi:hypothetical protein
MVLIFDDGLWTIVTSSWSFGQNDPDSKMTVINYVWGSGFGTDTHGVAHAKLRVPLSELFTLISNCAGAVCDLRPLQRAINN